jgi:CheY-like chemotaxis protein
MNGAQAEEKNKQYVLVVDPNLHDRLDTCLLLLKFGRNIFTAGTAEEALEYMNLAPPVAVVAVTEPGGPTLLSRIKNDLRFLNVPLILLSSSPDPSLEEEARKGGFAAYLRKPLDVEEFYRVVQTVIEKGPRRKIRIAAYLPASLADPRGAGQGHITVLSEAGSFFRTLDLRPKGSLLSLKFELKGRAIEAEATVLYSSTFDEGPSKEPGMGIKFRKISHEDRELIRAFILERIREGTAKLSTKN